VTTCKGTRSSPRFSAALPTRPKQRTCAASGCIWHRGARAPKINATVSALRFLFNVTLDRPDLAKQLAFMHEPRKVSRGSKQPAAGLAVSGPEPDQPDDDAPAHARLPCRGRDRGDYEAGDAAHLAPQLCLSSRHDAPCNEKCCSRGKRERHVFVSLSKSGVLGLYDGGRGHLLDRGQGRGAQECGWGAGT
jgi:hypothetical protein